MWLILIEISSNGFLVCAIEMITSYNLFGLSPEAYFLHMEIKKLLINKYVMSTVMMLMQLFETSHYY